MKLLLDTHVLLWMLIDAVELSVASQRAISDARNEKLLSVVSLWEITIKVSLGKLDVGAPLERFLAELEAHPMIRLLPIETPHLLQLATMPQHHRDPFDRMIVAQSLNENCTLISKESRLDAYGIKRLW